MCQTCDDVVLKDDNNDDDDNQVKWSAYLSKHAHLTNTNTQMNTCWILHRCSVNKFFLALRPRQQLWTFARSCSRSLRSYDLKCTNKLANHLHFTIQIPIKSLYVLIFLLFDFRCLISIYLFLFIFFPSSADVVVFPTW